MGGPSANDAWTIVLAAFRGEEAAQAAQFALARVVDEGGLQAARIQRRGEAFLLTIGAFDGPGDPRAAAELERVQTLQIRGASHSSARCSRHQNQPAARSRSTT
ncbi:MAG: hypothetical protein HRU13_05330 [Phycisphaerales bacterium]|nr:hypothetical protein [Phycisphaerales bacterium]